MGPLAGVHGQLCLLRAESLVLQSQDKEVPGEVAQNSGATVVPSEPGPISGGLRVARGDEGTGLTAMWLVRQTELGLSCLQCGGEQAAGTEGRVWPWRVPSSPGLSSPLIR